MKVTELFEATDKTIVFANNNQVILYECELSGQISDGHWENASPRDHWKDMTGAHVTFSPDPAKQGVYGFYPRRKYGFASPQLLEVVGNRMLFYVKFYNTYKSIGLDHHHTVDMLEDNLTSLMGHDDGYFEKKAQELMHLLNLGSKEELKMVVDKVNQFPYSMLDMRKDLREMSKIVTQVKQ